MFGDLPVKKVLDVDYSYYLGPNYKETESSLKPIGGLMNHVGFYDSILARLFYPGSGAVDA